MLGAADGVLPKNVWRRSPGRWLRFRDANSDYPSVDNNDANSAGFVILTASVVVAGQDGAWCSPNVPGTSQQSVEYEIAEMSLVLTDPRSPNVHLKEFHSISAQVSSYSDYFWVD